MGWIHLLFAGLLEIAWAVAMKQSDGFSRAVPTGVMVVSMAGSFWLLALAMRTLPLGTAYTIWTGIGAIGAFIVGAVAFGEVLSPGRVIAAALLLAGMVLMKISTDG